MCGIVGVVNSSGSPANTLESIAHRGPDDTGDFVEGRLFLGHQRLSILDLSPLGHQPMHSADGRYVLVYNGEIYNHLELRAELEPRYDFRSTSDTETLLYALVEFGPACLARLNGIFAFAFYDRHTQRLLLVRDHFGIKPLYYYWSGGVLAFGSELKALTRLADFKGSVDEEALLHYLSLLWCPGEMTPFREVRKLPGGHYLDLDLSQPLPAQPSLQQFYDIPFDQPLSNASEAELIDQLDEHLQRAVERQLLSDVPLGFFLSGGLDSSLLVAIARRLHPHDRIQCFTMDTRFMEEQEGFVSDLHYAQLVADHLHVELEVIDTSVNVREWFDRMIWHLDEPQADPAPLNVLKICERARAMGYKVLLGGAGGDDLFSGYRRHQALNFERLLRLLPAGTSRMVNALLNRFRADHATVRRLRKVLTNTGATTHERITNYFLWYPTALVRQLFLEPEVLNGVDPTDYLKQLLLQLPSDTPLLNQLLYLELKTFLPDHNLNYTDKMSMAVGVEVRVPFLDLELVDFSTRLPVSLKMKGKMTKYLLRKVAERYLPQEVIYRPKTGFGAPVRKWINDDLRPLVDDYLSVAQLRRRRLFDPQAVRQLIDDNRTGRVDASYPIWCLLAIESWMRQFVDTQPDSDGLKYAIHPSTSDSPAMGGEVSGFR